MSHGNYFFLVMNAINWTGFLSATFFSAAILFLLIRFKAFLPVDVPNERSLHATPIPRIGGLALIPAALITWLLMYQQLGFNWFVLAACTVVLFILSAMDDRYGLPVKIRLLVHVFAAALLGMSLTSEPWPYFGCVLAIVWAVNLFNFMDGANGLAGGMACIGFATLGVAATGDMSILAFALSGAALGFLFFNFHPARVFLGDAGSIPLGFIAGGLSVIGAYEHIWPLWFPVLVFSPFFVDATVTLVGRALRRQRVWQAHRDHYYQRLIRCGWSHRRLALAEYGVMLVAAISALLFKDANSDLVTMMLIAWGAAYALVMWFIDRHWALQEGQ